MDRCEASDDGGGGSGHQTGWAADAGSQRRGEADDSDDGRFPAIFRPVVQDHRTRPQRTRRPLRRLLGRFRNGQQCVIILFLFFFCFFCLKKKESIFRPEF